MEFAPPWVVEPDRWLICVCIFLWLIGWSDRWLLVGFFVGVGFELAQGGFARFAGFQLTWDVFFWVEIFFFLLVVLYFWIDLVLWGFGIWSWFCWVWEKFSFKLYDFVFELKFFGFFVCLFPKKIFGFASLFIGE